MSLTWAAVALTALAAEDIYRVQISGPSGTSEGKLIASGDQVIVVDNARPENTVSIPRSDIRNVVFRDGTLTMDLARPITDRHGSRDSLVVRFSERASGDAFVKWIGLPAQSEGTVVRRVETETTTTRVRTDNSPQVRTEASPQARTEYAFDARHDHAVGNCTGKLIAREDKLAFESVGEADHSRSWSYNEIKELDRNKSENKIIIEPYHGDHFTLKLTEALDDEVFKVLTDRIVAARPRR